MDICITAIRVVRGRDAAKEVLLTSGLIPITGHQPAAPVFMIDEGLTDALTTHLEEMVLPATVKLLSAKLFKRTGGLDLLQIELELPWRGTEASDASTITAWLETPEDLGEDYLIEATGIVPKVFTMSTGKTPKPTGRCPICFERHTLTEDGTMKRHTESLSTWNFNMWCHRGLLETEDRRADLIDLNHAPPKPSACGGSYLPPLESSTAGLLWAIQLNREAIADQLRYQAKLAAGSVDEVLVSELVPHEDYFGNRRCFVIIKNDNPRFAQCLEDEIKASKVSIEHLSSKILELRALIAWVSNTHKYGTSHAPLDCLKIDIDHAVRFSLMTPKEAKELVVKLDRISRLPSE